jgi:hypothetical protein
MEEHSNGYETGNNYDLRLKPGPLKEVRGYTY